MKRILIVEDHPDTQSLLCDLLELEGYEVRCSGEAHGVLGLARRMNPDLIVLDVKLPGLSGIELLELLNRDRQMRQVPVLMCSGAVDELNANREQIEAAGRESSPSRSRWRTCSARCRVASSRASGRSIPPPNHEPQLALPL